MSDPAFLQIRDLTVGYGGNRVLDALSLEVCEGEFVALLGASGCGKTTLLRTIAGFADPSEGEVVLAGSDITRRPPDRRGMALVFQSYALWPHMTVAQTIGYGLKLRRVAKPEIARRVAEMQALLGLEGLQERKPAQLSGGQRQRVALGRALAIEPQVLLLDEPLSNLDARVRLTLRHEIRALQSRLGITAVHVTHDREEAMVMADRIVLIDRGRIAQAGTPDRVYNHPASAFVAAFMGAENVLELRGTVTGQDVHLAAGAANAPAAVPVHGRNLTSGRFEARFRSEAAVLLPADAAPVDGALDLVGVVRTVSYPGGLWRHLVVIGDRDIHVDAAVAHPPGTPVTVRVPSSALFLFDAAPTASPPPSSP
ncbi:ABC transporter ATP-binding protein [Mangrovibrevibacter kandeliae]|uniref:ABC transporter ATP-binding protein n=1 Tax=Mangrovibrevibacter kandeliae TaxID=2968473 RepID=UPI002117800C|nr:ABC transporter ATP-binding protein [Aurantimonas sp. CSK15Z-1]MCQ8784112.1 ABC transporter ATP-binding protein [Aurantimonas sp. CSK15Z-1]